MASNTGCTSEGELAITFRCRPSPSAAPALPRLVEQPCVLDRDHRLVGEGLQQLDLMGGERAGPGAVTLIDADRPPCASGGRTACCGSRAAARISAIGGRSSASVSGSRTVSPVGSVGTGRTHDGLGKPALQGFVGRRAGRRERREMDGAIDEAEHRSRKAADTALALSRSPRTPAARRTASWRSL